MQNTTAYLDNLTGLAVAGVQIVMAGTNMISFNNNASTQINATVYAPLGTVSLIMPLRSRAPSRPPR